MNDKIWILVGIAVLIPWNSFLKSLNYFGISLSDTVMRTNFTSWITSSYTLCNILTMIFAIFFKIDKMIIGGGSDVLRIKRSFFITLILMAFMTILPSLNMMNFDGLKGNVFMIILIIIIGLIGFILAILQKSIFSFLSKISSKKSICHFMSGQALSGVLTSLINLFLNIGIGDKSDRAFYFESFLYFSITTMIVLMAFISLYHIDYQLEMEDEDQPYTIKDVWDVFKIIWTCALQVFLCLFVTLAFYASFIVNTPLKFDSFKFILPLILLLYDIGDWIGRWMVSQKTFYMHKDNFLCKIMPLMRLFIFTPLFYCAPIRINIDHAFLFDLPVYAFIVFSFGISNGYCNTVFFIHVQELIQSNKIELDTFKVIVDNQNEMQDSKKDDFDHQDNNDDNKDNDSCPPNMNQEKKKKIAGTIMGLFICLGLAMGSLTSFLLIMLTKKLIFNNL